MPAPALILLTDMLTEIAGVREITKAATFEAFSTSWGMKRAVQHALLILAEAAKNLPSELKADEPHVSWRDIHAFGNMLRHEYRRLDDRILWAIIEDDLEPLEQALRRMLTTIART